jgi:phytanoyl-CoA hydroxylase
MPAPVSQVSTSNAPASPPGGGPGLTIDQYTRFRREGVLVVPGLCQAAEVERLLAHGRQLSDGSAGPGHPADQHWFPMLHRTHALHERMALHPGVLDVVQALIGTDVMAMQTMLFLKPPGERGNGWHQDSWYLQTIPDSLCGAWMALDACDEENGALVVAVGSHVEPVYSHDGQPHPDRDHLAGMRPMPHLHHPDDAVNELAAIAARYPQVVVHAQPGDVVFLHGHVLHTSLPNVSRVRRRRAFVCHYANARSFTSWGSSYPSGHPQHAAPDPAWGGSTNGSCILARGTTPLPCGRPGRGRSPRDAGE